jgi:hypothetical protein
VPGSLAPGTSVSEESRKSKQKAKPRKRPSILDVLTRPLWPVLLVASISGQLFSKLGRIGYTVQPTAMANAHKARLLGDFEARFGLVKKLEGSQSLFSIGENDARLYVRYSKVHEGGKSFFGLRDVDLRKLEGHDSHICFVLDDDSPPVFVPFADFEEVFRNSQVALDGQHKAQLLRGRQGLELYVARQGRFNVEAFVGFSSIESSIGSRRVTPTPVLSHSDVQTLLGGIGSLKGYDVWIPASDCGKLQWSLTRKFSPMGYVPAGYDEVAHIPLRNRRCVG